MIKFIKKLYNWFINLFKPKNKVKIEIPVSPDNSTQKRIKVIEDLKNNDKFLEHKVYVIEPELLKDVTNLKYENALKRSQKIDRDLSKIDKNLQDLIKKRKELSEEKVKYKVLTKKYKQILRNQNN